MVLVLDLLILILLGSSQSYPGTQGSRGWKDGRVQVVVNQYFATRNTILGGFHDGFPKVVRARTRATRAVTAPMQDSAGVLTQKLVIQINEELTLIIAELSAHHAG